MREEIERVRALLDGSERPGASAAEITATEQRLGLILPDSVRALVSSFDGSDGSTSLDNGWITFWPMRAWRRASTEPDARGLNMPDGILFADHGLVSWWYAFNVDPGQQDWSVHLVSDVRAPSLVAPSIVEFLQAIVADSRTLYGSRV